MDRKVRRTLNAYSRVCVDKRSRFRDTSVGCGGKIYCCGNSCRRDGRGHLCSHYALRSASSSLDKEVTVSFVQAKDQQRPI